MQPPASFLEGRLEQIAHVHIRQRLQALSHDARSMLEYIDNLFLDTRDGQRRGFDHGTATALLAIKLDLTSFLEERENRKQAALTWEQEFRVATPGQPYQPPVKLPKNW